MSNNLLNDFFGKDIKTLTNEEIAQKIYDFDDRLSRLESKYEYGEGTVFVDGSPEAVKTYHRDIIEQEKKNRQGGN